MPNPSAEAFEDGIDLQIGLLEAFVPSLEKRWAAYPFPNLKPTGEQEMRTFRTILLENPYIRVVIVPALGGRIISLFDKRTNTEILRRHTMIEPQAGGRRGAFVREGIQLCLDGQDRLNSLGNVATQIEHAADETSEAAVWISETCTGTGLSFHLRLSLPPDRAELRLEARVFNRSLVPELYNGGLSLYLGEGKLEDSTFYSAERDAGLAVFFGQHFFESIELEDGLLRIGRFVDENQLAARQVDTWTVTLTPLSGLGGCLGASQEAALNLRDGNASVQVVEQRLRHKVLLLTHDGKTHEAMVDLYPETVLEIPLGGLNPLAVALTSPAKQEILRVDTSGADLKFHTPRAQRQAPASHVPIDPFLPLIELQRATFDVQTRHAAHTALGMRALAEKRFPEAAVSFEQALMYNADDPLLWWAKAVVARLLDQENDAELLNAHYLAPLEPALRAESFLSQPINADPAPSPLLASLAENPEEFIEVACLLVEHGLFDQASRWIDEALRHRELPMLRYLMAYSLLSATKLEAEAAEQVRLAGQSPVDPPFPYREIERRALAGLANAFPMDKSVSIFAKLLRVD